ncbi:hypothetical protein BH09ACT6_BH09ACT6_18840 [soil metagenome]
MLDDRFHPSCHFHNCCADPRLRPVPSAFHLDEPVNGTIDVGECRGGLRLPVERRRRERNCRWELRSERNRLGQREQSPFAAHGEVQERIVFPEAFGSFDSRMACFIVFCPIVFGPIVCCADDCADDCLSPCTRPLPCTRPPSYGTVSAFQAPKVTHQKPLRVDGRRCRGQHVGTEFDEVAAVCDGLRPEGTQRRARPVTSPSICRAPTRSWHRHRRKPGLAVLRDPHICSTHVPGGAAHGMRACERLHKGHENGDGFTGREHPALHQFGEGLNGQLVWRGHERRDIHAFRMWCGGGSRASGSAICAKFADSVACARVERPAVLDGLAQLGTISAWHAPKRRPRRSRKKTAV